MTLDSRVGGSPFNVAVGLARLAQPVAFVASISQDFLGERLIGMLTSEGVSTQSCLRSAAPTTLSLVGLNGNGVPTYQFYGEGGADRQLTVEALTTIPLDARVFHIGSYATVAEPIASTLRDLVEREYKRGVITYDPNIRLNVVPDLTRWRAQFQWMLSRTHLLANWQRAGISLVVVTRGAKGAWAWCNQGHVDVPATTSAVVDTVGAGDTFQAALLTWLAENGQLGIPELAAIETEQLHSALSFAARAAAITCSRRGADLPWLSELR
jgi:fructokinase